MKRGISRLIDSYAQEQISKEEFDPRIKSMKQSLAIVEGQKKKLTDRRELKKLIGTKPDNCKESLSKIISEELNKLTEKLKTLEDGYQKPKNSAEEYFIEKSRMIYATLDMTLALAKIFTEEINKHSTAKEHFNQGKLVCFGFISPVTKLFFDNFSIALQLLKYNIIATDQQTWRLCVRNQPQAGASPDENTYVMVDVDICGKVKISDPVPIRNAQQQQTARPQQQQSPSQAQQEQPLSDPFQMRERGPGAPLPLPPPPPPQAQNPQPQQPSVGERRPNGPSEETNEMGVARGGPRRRTTQNSVT